MTLEEREKLGIEEKGRRFEQAGREAIRVALLDHQKHNNPVAILRDGKVVLVPAEEVLRSLNQKKDAKQE